MAAMELRPYQQEAREKIFGAWETVDRTLLVLPTGCGKTIVFAKVTEECVRRGGRVLILAHRGELPINSQRRRACAVRWKRQRKAAWEAGTG